MPTRTANVNDDQASLFPQLALTAEAMIWARGKALQAFGNSGCVKALCETRGFFWRTRVRVVMRPNPLLPSEPPCRARVGGRKARRNRARGPAKLQGKA